MLGFFEIILGAVEWMGIKPAIAAEQMDYFGFRPVNKVSYKRGIIL